MTEADLLVHVVDLSHPNREEQMAAVEEVLDELGAGDKQVVVAFNKIDRVDLADESQAAGIGGAAGRIPELRGHRPRCAGGASPSWRPPSIARSNTTWSR